MKKQMTISKIATWAITLSVLLLVWVYPLMAHAADGTEPAPSPTSELLFTLLKIVFSVLGILGSFLVMKGIGYFEKKSKIDLPASVEKMIFDWADQAVGLAHEKSHQVLQKTGQKLDGNAKLNIATGFVMDLVKKHKLDTYAEAKLTDYIEAKLGIKRMEESGVVAPVTPTTPEKPATPA